MYLWVSSCNLKHHKKMITILKYIGFKDVFHVDPCLMWWNDKAGFCFVGLYVDDNLAVGYPEAIHKFIQELIEHGLTLKVEDDLHDYLS